MPSNSNSGTGGFFGRPGQTERSSSGVLEDIKKLLLIALLCGPVAGAGCGLLYLTLWIAWSHFDKWAARQWFRTWGDMLLVVPLALWALAFLVLFVTWIIEMINKHWPPAYGPADPNNGLMGPLWGLVQSIRTMGLLRDSGRDRYERLFGSEDTLRQYIEDTMRELSERDDP